MHAPYIPPMPGQLGRVRHYVTSSLRHIVQPPPGQCTGNHEVACNNGHCVPIEYRCDGDDDCGDGTDERGCRKLVMNISMMMVTVMSAI